MINVMLNVIVASFIALAILVPAKNYFTIMVILFGIYFILDYFYKKMGGKKWLAPIKCEKNIVWGLVIFFICLFTSSFITLDMDNIGLTFSFFKSALSFLLIGYMLTQNHTIAGGQIGILGSVLVICVDGFFQFLQSPNIRIGCFYGNPNDFAKMIISLLPCLIYLFFRENRKWFKVFIVLEILAISSCLIFTASRGAILGIVTGFMAAIIGIYCLHSDSIKKTQLKRVITFSFLFLAIGIGSLIMIQSHRIDAAKMGGERIQMWESSIEMMQDHPLIGVGAAKWKKEYSEHYHKPGIKEYLGFPHNMFMYFGACFGVIGLGGYILYLALPIKGIYHSAKVYANAKVTFSLLMLFISFLIESCFDNTLNYKMPATLYFTIFGYLFVQYFNDWRMEQREHF